MNFYLKLFFIIIFCYSHLGFSVTKKNSTNKTQDQQYKHLKKFSDLLHIIEKSYVKKISLGTLIENAIKGIVKNLDPHSYFLSKQEFKHIIRESQGKFSGFGMELEIQNKKPIIISVLQNSPARKAGIKPGQILLQINNKKTVGLSKRELSKLLTTKKGTKFSMVVQDADLKNIHQLQLRTEIVSFKSVVHKNLTDQFFYIRINVFTEKTAQEIKNIIKKYKNPAGLLLDLRGTPGGLFYSAIQVADLFIKKGTIVSIKGRVKDYEQTFKAHLSKTILDCPIFVLIDNYSASAAEILAGALKDHKRGILLGRTSFGKGSVQSIIKMDYGSAIKLTVAYYYTPNGGSIHKIGIKPHIELQKTIPAKNTQKSIIFTSKEDTEFSKALSYLKVFRFFNPVLK